MSGYTPAKKPAARAPGNTYGRKSAAQGVASAGSARARRTVARARTATAAAVVPSVPEQVNPDQAIPAGPAVEPRKHAYVAREHLRKDIGSRVLVLDLAASDAPPGAPVPLRDPEGVLMQYVADCVTHDVRKHFVAYGTACRAAKASHQWCPGCKSDLARHHRLHSKASAQASPRR